MGKYIKYIDPNCVSIASYVDNKIVCYDDIKKLSEGYDRIISDLYNYFSDNDGDYGDK